MEGIDDDYNMLWSEELGPPQDIAVRRCRTEIT